MGFYFESFLQELILFVILFNVLVYFYFQWKFSYWSRRKIPYLKPVFPFGNLKNTLLRKETLGVAMKKAYEDLKCQGVKYGGIFMFAKPVFMPLDPELIKQIMVKDFNHFRDRGVFHDEETDPLSAHLFAIEGQKWRNLRTKLSPTFTSGKMKMMYQTVMACANELEVILEEATRTAEPIDIKEIVARFTTDIISSCAFGLDGNSLKDPNSEFRTYGRKIFDLDFIQGLKNLIGLLMPEFLMFFKLTIQKPEVTNFFMNMVKQTVEYREKNNVDRKDMMSLLLKIKNNQSLDDDKVQQQGSTDQPQGLSLEELAAQCFVFFIGGFETSSTASTFTLFELAQHQDIQDKLRDEIRSTIAKYGELSYEAVMDMPYMDKVINESLRKYPPLPFLNRICAYDWKIPSTDKVLEKGSFVIIPMYGTQMDPEYFPEPEKFDPERFSEENKNSRHAFCYLPFGDGPRNCIGMRFGLVQTKVGLAVLLKNHRFTLDPSTKLPIEFDVNNVILGHKYGIWLQSTKI